VLTAKQINELVRLLKNATIADLSQVAHGLSADFGREAAGMLLTQVIRLMELPPLSVKRACNITFLTVPADHAIPIIKLIREYLNCGLKEAKDMYDNRLVHSPAHVSEDLIQRLRQLGVELKIQQV
jgi:ribosomal protein L7/L12